MKLRTHIAAGILACTVFTTGCLCHSFEFPATRGRVVRRVDRIPRPETNALVYLTFAERYTINAWGIGPTSKTVQQYDFYTRPNPDGTFGFPPLKAHYWSPIFWGHPHSIAPPTIQSIAQEEWTWIDDFTPTNVRCDLRSGTTFRNQPFLIPTNAVFVDSRALGMNSDKSTRANNTSDGIRQPADGLPKPSR